MNFRCKFRHRRSIPRPRFTIRVQNFGDLATFSVNFCILYSEYAPYFYFRFVWPTDLESIPHSSTPKLIIPSKFEVDMTIHCRVTAFLSADTLRDWWPWPLTFWLEQLSYMTGNVHNNATKFEDPKTIRSWVTSYNVSLLLALKMLIKGKRYIWMSAIFRLPVCLTYWPIKYTTRVDPHVDNSHQVWSWHDHTLPS